MNFFLQNLATSDISDEVPNVHIDNNGIITQANKLFHYHFPHPENSKINDVIKLKRIDNSNYCLKNGYLWKIIDTRKRSNYIIFLVPQIDITPDLWNILTIPMILINKDGIILESNKAYDIQFSKPKMEFVGKYCSGFQLSMLKQHLIKDLIWEGKRAKITFYSIDDMWFFMINTDIDIHNNEQSIRQITASVVHDFRNILTVLKGYSDLMLEDPQSMYITKMQETITRSTEMINKLLRFTRSDEIIYTKIYDVLLNMKDVLIRLLGKQITLKLEIKENIAYIGLSTIDLERIITNMAINAKEAMNETGILKITLYKKYFETNWILNETILRAGFYAVLQFEDTGCGISEEEIDNIFSPFYTTKPNGNGIGLSTIVSMLKEVSGGIKCQSKLNIGTKFDLYFPIIQGTNIASPVRLKQQANTDCAKSIILVEDTHDIREILEISLKKAGYIVYSFGTAEEAIDCISTLIEIDLIITDANLPGKSGACIVSAGRKKKPSLQTIVISGFDRNRLFQMFPNDSIFISKPIHVGNFIATVNQILQNKKNDDS